MAEFISPLLVIITGIARDIVEADGENIPVSGCTPANGHTRKVALIRVRTAGETPFPG